MLPLLIAFRSPTAPRLPMSSRVSVAPRPAHPGRPGETWCYPALILRPDPWSRLPHPAMRWRFPVVRHPKAARQPPTPRHVRLLPLLALLPLLLLLALLRRVRPERLLL